MFVSHVRRISVRTERGKRSLTLGFALGFFLVFRTETITFNKHYFLQLLKALQALHQNILNRTQCFSHYKSNNDHCRKCNTGNFIKQQIKNHLESYLPWINHSINSFILLSLFLSLPSPSLSLSPCLNWEQHADVVLYFPLFILPTTDSLCPPRTFPMHVHT